MAMPIAIEIAQPAVPRRSERRATRCSTSSIPAKKNRKTRPKLARKSMWVSISAQAEPFRADQDPEQDLEDDGRQDDPAVQPRENRAGARSGEDEHEGARVQLGTGAAAASGISSVTQGA